MEQSATLPRVAVALRRGEEWPAPKKKMGGLQVCPDPRLLSWGNWRLPKGVGAGGVILYDWPGLLIWRSLIGPALETGPKIRDADRLGCLLRWLWFGFPGVVCSTLWVRVLLS